ncbi:hypothetical protein LMG33818_002548 [Halomonadaceae bacterium LMG 33818]|uniref:hypothetical protein n=1 Tax=Cernens ardua TaxID=3402176 RepID=UPI003EDC7652
MENFNCFLRQNNTQVTANAFVEIVDDKNIKINAYLSTGEYWRNIGGTYREEDENFIAEGKYELDEGGLVSFKFTFKINYFNENILSSFGEWVIDNEPQGNRRATYKFEVWSSSSERPGSSLIPQLLGDLNDLQHKALTLKTSHQSITQQIEDVKKTLKSVETENNNLNASQTTLIGNISDFNKSKDEAEDLVSKLKADKEKVGQMQEDNTKIKQELEDIKKSAESTNNQALAALDSTTTMGLAKSFKDRKDAAGEEAKKYSKNFYISVGISLGVVLLAFFGPAFFHYTVGGAFENWAIRVPIVVFLVWLVLFTSKKASQQSALMEFYAQKQALAESYQGYKKQVEEVSTDDDDLKNLIKMLLIAISRDSAEVLDRSEKINHLPGIAAIFGLKKKDTDADTEK